MKRNRGFTLIELMISMLLGLLIVGAVIGVMLANKRSYGTNQGLGQVQESARTAYELLAHDIRQADGTGCGQLTGATSSVASVLNAGALWWEIPFGFSAYDSTEADPAVAIGTAVGERVAGTDSIQVQGMDGAGLSIDTHTAGTWRLDIGGGASDFVAGDVMLVCDSNHAAIFQASGATVSGTVFHSAFAGAPGNCSGGLGFPRSCPPALENVYSFPRNAQIGRLFTTDWYIGNNGRAGEGGRSLYRIRIVEGLPVTEEVAAGVTDLQLQFRANGSDAIILNPSLVLDWTTISSVLIQLTAQSSDTNVTTDNSLNNGRIERTFNYLISLRNRLQ